MPALDRPFQTGQTIVFEGGSHVSRRAGPGLADWPFLRLAGADRTWCDLLAELLFAWHAELNLTFRNVGVSGSTSRMALDRFEEFVQPHDPDWIFLVLGGNDVNQGMSLDETRYCIRAYVTRARETCGAQCVYLGGFRPGPNIPQRRIDADADRQQRYRAIGEAATEAGGHYLDLGPGVLQQAEAPHAQYPGHNLYGTPDPHFSLLGHTVIAGELLKALGYLR